MKSATAAPDLVLYGYWRSSAVYRVRIGLNLKGLRYRQEPVHLLRDGGQQHSAAYRALNPQELVPTLADGALHIGQSLAILEYLDERDPSSAPLLPKDAALRARARQLALMVACDIHPLNNLRVLNYLNRELAVAEDARDRWVRHWITQGFTAIEALLSQNTGGAYCLGDTPGLADCLLIPQVYNARRFAVDLSAFPRIVAVDQACAQLPAFQQAHPQQQPDRE